MASETRQRRRELRGRGAGRESELIETVSIFAPVAPASVAASRAKPSKLVPSPALTTW